MSASRDVSKKALCRSGRRQYAGMRFMKQLPASRWHNITNYKQIQGTTLALDIGFFFFLWIKFKCWIEQSQTCTDMSSRLSIHICNCWHTKKTLMLTEKNKIYIIRTKTEIDINWKNVYIYTEYNVHILHTHMIDFLSRAVLQQLQ